MKKGEIGLYLVFMVLILMASLFVSGCQIPGINQTNETGNKSVSKVINNAPVEFPKFCGYPGLLTNEKLRAAGLNVSIGKITDFQLRTYLEDEKRYANGKMKAEFMHSVSDDNTTEYTRYTDSGSCKFSYPNLIGEFARYSVWIKKTTADFAKKYYYSRLLTDFNPKIEGTRIFTENEFGDESVSSSIYQPNNYGRSGIIFYKKDVFVSIQYRIGSLSQECIAKLDAEYGAGDYGKYYDKQLDKLKIIARMIEQSI